MNNLLDRMEYEPEIFTVVDGLFLQVNGETVMVRTFGGWFWSIPVRGGEFPYGGNTVGFHRLTVLQNIRANRGIRNIKKEPTP